MQNLLRLTYISRAIGILHTGELDLLLREARERNGAFGVTGLLCTGRGYYLQALEGPESQVLAVYTKILLDPRHKDSELLSIGLVKDRAFAQWQMGHVDGKALGEDIPAKLRGQVQLDADLSKPGKILQSTLDVLRKAA